MQLSKIWKTSNKTQLILKGVAISTMLFLLSGCTINGKTINQIMDKNTSQTQKKVTNKISDNNQTENNKSNNFKINLKWANKEYHNGEEDIKFHVNLTSPKSEIVEEASFVMNTR